MEEYQRNHESPDPTPKLRENIGGKIFCIRKFIGYMAHWAGGKLQTLGL